MDGSGSPVAPDSCDAEKMPSETHPDGCVVECPEVAEEDQAGPANATDTDAEGDPGASADGEATGPFGIPSSFLPAAKPAGLWMILSFFPEDLSNRAL